MKERQFMMTPTCLEMNILVSLDKIKKKNQKTKDVNQCWSPCSAWERLWGSILKPLNK